MLHCLTAKITDDNAQMSGQTPLPARRSLRLRHFDYTSPGCYFVTLCCYQHRSLFGQINQGQLTASPTGKIVNQQIQQWAQRYPQLSLDTFVMMPNHLHLLCTLRSEPAPVLLGSCIGALKSICWQQTRHLLSSRLWQRNYFEHIVRNENSRQVITAYIENNPRQWTEDRFYRDHS